MSNIPPALKRAITRFDNAAQEYAFRGSIPLYESDEAYAAYEEVVAEYEWSRELLARAIQRYKEKP